MVDNELIYEVLKKLQAGQAELKATLADIGAQLIRVRQDINSVQSDDLRRRKSQSSVCHFGGFLVRGVEGTSRQ